jgi:hypothetical protein
LQITPLADPLQTVLVRLGFDLLPTLPACPPHDCSHERDTRPIRYPGDDGHNVASMGGFVMLGPPAILAAAESAAAAGVAISASGTVQLPVDAAVIERVEAAAADAAATQLLLTHRSEKLVPFARVYGALLAQVRTETGFPTGYRNGQVMMVTRGRRTESTSRETLPCFAVTARGRATLSCRHIWEPHRCRRASTQRCFRAFSAGRLG